MRREFSRRRVLGSAGAFGAALAGSATARGVAFGAGSSSSAGALVAPRMTVTWKSAGVFPGEIFSTYDGGAAIADSGGAPLWSTSRAAPTYANFQVQRYRGDDVLTWWQGAGGPGSGGVGTGQAMVTTLDHKPVATIGASDGYAPDAHEFRITPENTALLTTYRTIPYDLSPVGGPSNGQLRDACFEEVDIASGRVAHRWSAIDRVSLTDSYHRPPTDPQEPYDFFHLNSISPTPDDHLLLSARNTCALYKVHRRTGEILWTLGGKSSSWRVDQDAVFGFQHHAIFEGANTIRLFDDGSDERTTWHLSRVVWLRLDTGRKVVSLDDSMSIPGVRSFAMGSAQRLPNGNVFVSWGSTPRLSEFSPRGELVFDAALPAPSYRAFKFRN